VDILNFGIFPWNKQWRKISLKLQKLRVLNQGILGSVNVVTKKVKKVNIIIIINLFSVKNEHTDILYK